MSEGNSIKNWLEDDRPREKMLMKGASVLSNAELFAILIATGSRKKSALDLAKEILALGNNNLRELSRLSLKELMQINGIGEAKAITIAAALEIGRRRQLAEGLERQVVGTPKEAAAIVRPLLTDLNHECFCVLFLDITNKLIRYEITSQGGLSATVVDVRLILKSALMCNASKLVVAHNHPSGNLTPSHHDKLLTQKIKEAASIMDIRLNDHIIIGNDTFLSMADEGLV